MSTNVADAERSLLKNDKVVVYFCRPFWQVVQFGA